MKKLDTIFSQYIRLRDTNDYGFGECITCKEAFHYDEFECGHFRHRRHLCTRWHEKNAHAQCFVCNREDDICAYIVAILDKYDNEIVDNIIWLSQSNYKFTKYEMEVLYDEYREKAEELLKDKMFKVNLK